ncbi:hypothetical protein SSEA_SKINNY_70 [Mycobacterium phage Skinny]|uniref:SsDNA binding protein n=1 Tax=Mycobacterium phage LilhomieP TaxID=2591221 RepID=A0A514DJ36_9CAUD|nr:hypothetical protein SEA_LILHOMIEP_67 [Mycobacterium phage LilhomieP]QUU29268.1 hypothetical protein [Mycobacterium phage SirSheldon]UXE05269.1 hypothetical protein SSEA_SKINNY_70 [Mycobacterium phage Skinny]WMI33247.1 hypothetical protein SEA_SLIMJIMMY_67 [Mycobacterium phage SlimJimmy]WNN95650.1 hypothetical protein SEA_GLASKE16_69 [Mycobacterium phage Glaske16]
MARLTAAQLRKKHQDTFEKFWAAYPRHTHITEAQKAWADLMEEGRDANQIVSAARRYAASVANTDMKYVPGPHNWLRAGQYDDADLFQDERQAQINWLKQMWKTANVKAVEDRFHVTMPKKYPPEDITEPDAVAFWYRTQAQAWIFEMYKEKYEKCPTATSQPASTEPATTLF